MQVAFYGSTPNHAFIVEQLGREGTTERTRDPSALGPWGELARAITAR
jgi:hypothetical protein